MDTLTWMFFIMSFVGGGYIFHRITKWYYKRKIKKLDGFFTLEKGDKVICIDDSPPLFEGFPHLKKGETYTVQQVLNVQDIIVDCGTYGWEKKRFVPFIKIK